MDISSDEKEKFTIPGCSTTEIKQRSHSGSIQPEPKRLKTTNSKYECTLYKGKWHAIKATKAFFKDSKSVAKLMLSTATKVNTSVPLACDDELAFLVDTSKLEFDKDLTCDGTGNYNISANYKAELVVDNDQNTFLLKEGHKPGSEKYTLLRRCYSHRDNPGFFRTIYKLQRDGVLLCQIVIIRYEWSGEKTILKLTARGNCKHNNNPFIRAQKASKEELKEPSSQSVQGTLDVKYQKQGGCVGTDANASGQRDKALSISPEESGIEGFTLYELQAVWTQVGKIIDCSGSIDDFPCTSSQSISFDGQNFKVSCHDGLFACDEHCDSFILHDCLFCEHTLAVAEQHDKLEDFLRRINAKNRSSSVNQALNEEMKEPLSQSAHGRLNIEFQKQGGNVGIGAAAPLPRDRQRIYRHGTAGNKQVDYNKLVKKKECVRSIEIINDRTKGPYHRCVVYTHKQIEDMNISCTAGSIISFAGPFDLGQMYVTVASYIHQDLVNKRNEKNVLMPGALLVHERRDTETYQYFGNQISKALGNEQVPFVRTDGERAMYKGLKSSSSFSNSKHLICMIQHRRNVESKLQKLGLQENSAKILKSIYGEKHFDGLVDCKNEKQYDTLLLHSCNKWNDLETAETGRDPEFATWFRQYKSQEVKECMLKPMTQQTGLGDTQRHDCECLNSLLVKGLGGKKSWNDLVDRLEEFVKSKYKELGQAGP